MTMTSYPQGYGRRDPVPECMDLPVKLECPCCHGTGEHEYGAGMDADAVTCSVCDGWGELQVSRINQGEEQHGRT